jgi:hypothetical protein
MRPATTANRPWVSQEGRPGGRPRAPSAEGRVQGAGGGVKGLAVDLGPAAAVGGEAFCVGLW